MKNTKLIDLLSAMTENEFSRLKLFIQSPLYNHSQRAAQLFNLLEKEYPAFTEEKISDEVVFETIFGEKQFSSALLRNLISDLLKLCEQFVVNEKIGEQHSIRNHLLVNYFIDKKLFSSAENLLREWEQELKASPRDAEFFQSEYRLLYASFNIAFHRQYKGNLHKLYKKKNVEELLDKLQNYYLFEFTALSTEVVNSFKAHNQKFNNARLENIANYYLANDRKSDEVVMLRLQITQMLLTENEKLYPLVKETLEKIHHKIHKTDVQNMLMMLYGFAAERAWKGNQFFKNELNELTDLREKLNLLLDESGEINPIAFWNISQSKLNRKGKKASADFIRTYEKYLPERVRAETVQLVEASILFYEKKFDKALHSLLTVGKPFFASEIVYRKLLLKCYYELKQWDLLQSAIETTEKFLRNNSQQLPTQISSSLKKNIEAIKLLYKNASGENAYTTKLKTFIKTNTNMNDIEWVKEKFKESA